MGSEKKKEEFTRFRLEDDRLGGLFWFYALHWVQTRYQKG